MKLNIPNAIIATCISALLAWWLWEMGNEDLQKWLLACVGGVFIWIGLLGGMGVSYQYKRSGAQVRLIMLGLATLMTLACCVYSFFTFSAQGFCIPMGICFLLFVALALRIFKTEM